MHGWMDGWLGGWVGGWMDGLMDGWICVPTYAREWNVLLRCLLLLTLSFLGCSHVFSMCLCFTSLLRCLGSCQW